MVLNLDNSDTRQLVESCYRTTATLINPIIDWTDSEVWEFLHHYGCESNPEYQNGFHRIGCIGCPLAREREREFEIYPKYRELYVHAFDRMLKARKECGKDDTTGYWTSGEAVMRWWLGRDPLQITWEDYLKFKDKEETLLREFMW